MSERPPETDATTPPVETPILVVDYLTWLRLERGRAERTVEAYRRDLADWAGFLAARGIELDQATEDHLTEWIGALRDAGLAASTVKRRVVAARNLHRYLAEEELSDTDPGAAVVPPSVSKGLPKALSESEVGTLIDGVIGTDAVSRRDRAILETLYGTGVRISELVSLSLADIDLHDAEMRVIGKGDKERIVPVLGGAARALAEWIDVDGRGALMPARWRRRDDETAVFLNQRGGRLSRQGAWGVVKARGDAVGIGDRLSPHVLRHSCATHLLDHGADIRIVQELLGHASIGTTQVYTKVSSERLHAAWRTAHPRAAAG